jgi:GxxExxY protein
MQGRGNEIADCIESATTAQIVDAAALKLHDRLGPGLLESVYQTLLSRDLQSRGLRIVSQRSIPLEFEGIRFEQGLKLDLLVNDSVVVELKSVERLAPIHSKQVLTYLRLLNLRVGLLINFGAPTLKSGLHRIWNNKFRNEARHQNPPRF